MSHYYTADLHFGHKNILHYCNRPFTTVDEMDEVLLHNIQDTIGADDDLWIVGDFSFGRDKQPETLFEQIPGRKHLIIGNHDKKRVLELPWASVQPFKEMQDGDTWLTLCHYPLLTWNGARYGALNLFGHVHDN